MVYGQHIISTSKLLSSLYGLYFSLCFSHFLSFSLLIDLQNHSIIDYNVFYTCVDIQTYDILFIQRWLNEGQQTCPQTQR
jgi:hypothetical protein